MSSRTTKPSPSTLHQNVSQELPRQAKCLQGASQAAKMPPMIFTEQQTVSWEPPRQLKCVAGASKTSKMRPSIIPGRQNGSQKPPRQPKCLPGASQLGKMSPRSIPDSQNVSQELPRHAKCLQGVSQTAILATPALQNQVFYDVLATPATVSRIGAKLTVSRVLSNRYPSVEIRQVILDNPRYLTKQLASTIGSPK